MNPLSQKMPLKKPCKFFASGTCREGAECKFFHETSSQVQAKSQASSRLPSLVKQKTGPVPDRKRYGILPYVMFEGTESVMFQISLSSKFPFDFKLEPLAGRRNEDESPWKAATRECYEESAGALDFRQFETPEDLGDLLLKTESLESSDVIFHVRTSIIDVSHVLSVYDSNRRSLLESGDFDFETEGIALYPIVDSVKSPLRLSAHANELIKTAKAILAFGKSVDGDLEAVIEKIKRMGTTVEVKMSLEFGKLVTYPTALKTYENLLKGRMLTAKKLWGDKLNPMLEFEAKAFIEKFKVDVSVSGDTFFRDARICHVLNAMRNTLLENVS